MTKQVALADRTYQRLRDHRRSDESFSQVVERLLDASPKDPLLFLAMPKSDMDPDDWLAMIEADRAAATVDA